MAEGQLMNFTILGIESLPIPSTKRAHYCDSVEKGLGLYITTHGAKTFYIRKRVRGRDKRIIIGSPSVMPVETARKEARIIKDQIAAGLDPVQERKKSLRSLTLGQHYNDYMELYSKIYKKSWRHDEREIPKHLSHWFNRELIDITKYDIQKLHHAIYTNSGLYQANRIMQRLKALYNKAIEWGWQGTNPVAKIKLFKETSRDRFILPDEMPYLLEALNTEYNTTARDYLWMLLLTGARKTNLLQMRWEQVIWEYKIWRIPDSKNGETLLLPLVDRAMDILKGRKENSVSEWVFPSDIDPHTHFVNAKRVWKRMKQKATIYLWAEDDKMAIIIEQCRKEIDNDYFVDSWFDLIVERAQQQGITLPLGLMDIRLHDVRRTFGSYQAINGSSLTVIGKSLGHKSQQSTEIYARLNLDPVRASIQKATDTMFG